MEQKDKGNIHLVRRVLVPLLIVTLPIAAAIAYLLYYKQAQRSAEPASQSLRAAVSFGNDNWPVFRGDPALTGRAAGNLPDKLTLAWQFQTADAVRSAPIIVNNTVFAASMDKHVYAIDLVKGIEIWRFQTDDGLEAAPLYHQECIYIGSNSGVFFCIDARTGQKKWSFESDGKITGSANVAKHSETNRSVVLFGSYDNNLYGLDAETGALVFKYPAESYINGSIAVIDNAAVFGSCDANIYQVPIADPNTVKTIDAGSYVATNPAVDAGVIFAGSYEGIFLAADVKTQKPLWQFDESEDAFLSAPAVNETVLVVGCRDQNVYCLNRSSGKKIWTFSAQNNFDSSPVICGDKVAIGCDDGRLYLLDIHTGKEIFSYTLGAPVLSSPAIAKNHLIIGCDNGTIYAFIQASYSPKN
ncbi:MAG: outer membrane protein assembly factor BamB family protein [Planctomycetota bacterium]|jgi:outer membrane protein assembly factor BamB